MVMGLDRRRVETELKKGNPRWCWQEMEVVVMAVGFVIRERAKLIMTKSVAELGIRDCLWLALRSSVVFPTLFWMPDALASFNMMTFDL